MRILLFSEGLKLISQSGLGRAIKHQEKALQLNNIPYLSNKLTDDYDIIHINTVGLLSLILAKNARRKRKKVIMHAHSTEEDFRNSFFFSNPLSRFFKKWLQYAYKLANLIITPTLYSKKVLDTYGLGRPIHAVSNGIDLELFKNDQEKRASFREEYGFSEKDKVIISAGLLIKRKGILDFIELAETLPQYHFVWCGETPPLLQDPEIRKKLKKLPSNAHFIGYVKDMTRAYSGADLFFMPTYEETEGIVVLEALATKLPVLVRDIPVYKDWLKKGFHCYKGKNNKQFAGIIRGYLENRLKSLVENGYKVVEERSLEKVGHQLENIYQNLVGTN